MALTQVDQGMLGAQAQYTGFKNRIINGAMVIDQRNAGAAKTLTAGAVAYVLDRFYVATSGGAGVVQQVAGSGGFTKAMRITGASGVTDGYFGQKIESYNIADCASSTVTYKIRASSSVLTSLTWYARFPTAQDNYAGVTAIANGTITINSTPTDYTFQITLPSGVTNGLEVYFTFGSFTSGTLDITGVQLEKGSTATSFDYRPYGTELALCCRDCQVSYNEGVALGTVTTTGCITNQAQATVTYVPMTWNFPVKMRTTPTLTTYSTQTGTSGKFYSNAPAGDFNVAAGFIGATGATVTTGTTSISATGYVATHMLATAEL